MSDVTTEKPGTDAVLKGEDSPQTESNSQISGQNTTVRTESSSEIKTENSFPQITFEDNISTPTRIFKVPKVPLLKTPVERSVEHIHFDKKWASKRG